MKIKFILIISIILLIPSMITGCSKATPTSISDVNISLDPTILAFASPMAENLLVALKNNDIQAFRANYDDAMLKATTEDAFQSLRTQLESIRRISIHHPKADPDRERIHQRFLYSEL
jgi:hypothetical protein